MNSQFFLFYFLVFSCIKVGDNDPNVFLNSATTSKSVFLNENVVGEMAGCIIVFMIVLVLFPVKCYDSKRFSHPSA